MNGNNNKKTYRRLLGLLVAMAGPRRWRRTRIRARLAQTVATLVATPEWRLRRGAVDALLELG